MTTSEKGSDSNTDIRVCPASPTRDHRVRTLDRMPKRELAAIWKQGAGLNTAWMACRPEQMHRDELIGAILRYEYREGWL